VFAVTHLRLVAALAALFTPLAACASGGQEPYVMQREAMVRDQIAARGVKDPRVLEALGRVARERFVVSGAESLAYQDSPLSIGHGQTISQPYIVAVMSEAAAIGPTDVVLEIGTGSAYQTAVLAELAREVYTIEIIPELAMRAEALLRELGYGNVHTRLGDGYAGWPEHAPFDAIVVTAAPPSVPEALQQQLAVGGRLVVPVGTDDQELRVIERTADGLTQRRLMPVRFVPMVPGK
jgi:protein-L-isoaspartate(D-aspartate) O-methyltransferase